MSKIDQKLIGIKDICAYARRSESTIMGWIAREGFPADNVEGIWESTKGRVDSFYRAKATETLG